MAGAAQQSANTSLESVVSGIGDPVQRTILQKMDQGDKEQKEFTDKKLKDIKNLETPKPPTLTPSPDARDFQHDSMQTFGSAAMFLATFGSLLTRQPLVSALNSGAAVMNAVNKQDAAAFDKAFEKWKIDSENAWKMADWDLKAYEKALGKDVEEIRLYSTMHKNDTARYALEARMSEQNIKAARDNLKKGQGAQGAIIDYVNTKEKDAMKSGMPEDQIALMKPKWFGEALSESKGTKASDSTFDFSSLKPNDMVPGTGQTLASIDQKVEGLHRGVPYTSLGISMRTTKNPLKDAVDNRLSEKYPDFNYAKAQLKYIGEKREETALAGRSVMAKTAVKEMDHLAQPMIDAVKKLNPSDYPDWNSVKNAYDKKTGGADVIAAFQAVQDFKIAFDTLMTKNGASTDASREATNQIASINFSLNQIEAVRDQAKISGAGILDALAEVQTGITEGGNAATPRRNDSPSSKDIDYLRSYPSSKSSFDKHFGEGAADRVLSGE